MSKSDTFPYRKLFLPPFDIMFKTLQRTPVEIVDGVIHRNFPEDYMRCDYISDHFTETVRVRCHFGRHESPWEVWNKTLKIHKIKSPEEQREKIYSMTKECNTFNPSVAREIILRLVGEGATILDPSAGWGDRMIAAASTNAKLYFGIDPNLELKEPYKQMIESLSSLSPTKIKITHLPFEDTEVKPNSFDLVLTSPPFFDLEIYSTDSTQSTSRYRSKADWINLFFIPYIEKCMAALKPKGFLVVYAPDWMYEVIEGDYDCFFFSVGEGKTREIRVWQK